MFDLEIVSTATSISIDGCPFPSELSTPLTEWFDHLARLPVVRISSHRFENRNSPYPIRSLLAVLPTMHQINSLSLSVADASSLAGIFRALPESSITALSLTGLLDVYLRWDMDQVLTTQMVEDATRWLVSRPVTSLSLEMFEIFCDMDALERFCEALGTSTSLKTLRLSHCRLPEMVELALSPSVTCLELPSCGIDLDALESLCRILPYSQVVELNLSGNDIGADGMEHLASCLIDTKIQRLAVERCGITDRGCATLAHILPHSSLEEVDLARNQISDEGARHLADAIPHAVRLKKINLRANDLWGPGMASLVEAAAEAEALDLLVLAHNFISVANLQMLQKLIRNLALPIERIDLGDK
ncbi:hypothetical protein AC1031_011432 [Aphanomyces cochlioides]|nr:hypothetical protein AC1031_011432 [Aphanomyces cochlioides]